LAISGNLCRCTGYMNIVSRFNMLRKSCDKKPKIIVSQCHSEAQPKNLDLVRPEIRDASLRSA
jgi:xanthine dehydrogenase iron-sulfur cluster and FAD-binding subunit A